ncbi:hypothetical protein HB847_15635 [Listeria booriae]|uniref:Uncharacterized protein n=1 Tax=Listeria booriae TaxID=1552123 RepID=A0A841YA27_9LIST|nr:hypothetical protein [Listeria booriae]MBC1373783.1 hypothetical protein [Listeria booriae]
MARKPQVDMTNIDELLDEGIAENEVLNPNNSSNNASTDSDVKEGDTPSPFSFINEKEESVKKTFVVDSKIAEMIESLVTDPHNGKKLPGSKGFISKLVNNALRKELVALKVLDKEELKKNLPY